MFLYITQGSRVVAGRTVLDVLLEEFILMIISYSIWAYTQKTQRSMHT